MLDAYFAIGADEADVAGRRNFGAIDFLFRGWFGIFWRGGRIYVNFQPIEGGGEVFGGLRHGEEGFADLEKAGLRALAGGQVVELVIAYCSE